MKQCIGLDLGTKNTAMQVMSPECEMEFFAELPTTRQSLKQAFRGLEESLVCLEVGTVSPWVCRLLEELGHEVLCVNPRRLKLIAESTLKTDRLDAQTLARLARLFQLDPKLLPRVQHRSEEVQRWRSRLTARRALVNARAQLVNTARGLARTLGHALPSCRTSRFHVCVPEAVLPPEVVAILAPLVASCRTLSEQIAILDEQVEQTTLADSAARLLTTIPGVGNLTALSFVLCIEDPTRFQKSRQVGPYLGMRPRLRESGETRRRGRITAEGDNEVRSLLVEAAHRLLQLQPESEIYAWARRLLRQKKRQVVAVALARRLAVLMHRMWITGEDFKPFPTKAVAACA